MLFELNSNQNQSNETSMKMSRPQSIVSVNELFFKIFQNFPELISQNQLSEILAYFWIIPE